MVGREGFTIAGKVGSHKQQMESLSWKLVVIVASTKEEKNPEY